MGLITLPLRSDYLAIATIGIAEIVRLVLKNEAWLTNGVRGIAGIPKPLAGLLNSPWVMLTVVLLVLGLTYWASDRAYRAPWGRVLRAIREDEPATLAAGKNVVGFRLQGFVLGSMIMGVAGALYAHFVGFISPEAFQPEFTTFIVWVMLIAGGSGNTRGGDFGSLRDLGHLVGHRTADPCVAGGLGDPNRGLASTVNRGAVAGDFAAATGGALARATTASELSLQCAGPVFAHSRVSDRAHATGTEPQIRIKFCHKLIG